MARDTVLSFSLYLLSFFFKTRKFIGTKSFCSTTHVESEVKSRGASDKSVGNPDRSRSQRKLAFSRNGAETSSSFPAAEKRPQRRRHSKRTMALQERLLQQLAHNTGATRTFSKLYAAQEFPGEISAPPKGFYPRALGRTFAINSTCVNLQLLHTPPRGACMYTLCDLCPRTLGNLARFFSFVLSAGVQQLLWSYVVIFQINFLAEFIPPLWKPNGFSFFLKVRFTSSSFTAL